MTLKIEEVLLNENLIHSQEVQDDSIHAIKSLHVLLDLVSKNPELVGVDQVSEIVHGIEFAFQKLWNFPQNENFHRYQFMIKGCECPKMDNEDMFRSGQPYRYYNMECPIHSAKMKETKKSEKPEPEHPKETRLSDILELIGDMKAILNTLPK